MVSDDYKRTTSGSQFLQCGRLQKNQMTKQKSQQMRCRKRVKPKNRREKVEFGLLFCPDKISCLNGFFVKTREFSRLIPQKGCNYSLRIK